MCAKYEYGHEAYFFGAGGGVKLETVVGFSMTAHIVHAYHPVPSLNSVNDETATKQRVFAVIPSPFTSHNTSS